MVNGIKITNIFGETIYTNDMLHVKMQTCQKYTVIQLQAVIITKIIGGILPARINRRVLLMIITKVSITYY